MDLGIGLGIVPAAFSVLLCPQTGGVGTPGWWGVRAVSFSLSFFYFFPQRLIYLSERQSYRERNRRKDRDFFHLLVQEPRTPSKSPIRVSGAQTLRPFSFAFLHALVGSWLQGNS